MFSDCKQRDYFIQLMKQLLLQLNPRCSFASRGNFAAQSSFQFATRERILLINENRKRGVEQLRSKFTIAVAFQQTRGDFLQLLTFSYKFHQLAYAKALCEAFESFRSKKQNAFIIYFFAFNLIVKLFKMEFYALINLLNLLDSPNTLFGQRFQISFR